MKSRFILRTRVITGLFALAACFLVVRLYFVQVVHGEEYRRSAVAQYVDSSVDTGNRGSIFFTTKTGQPYSAAIMQTGWRIAIVPKDVADPETTYAKLSAATTVDKQRFLASAEKKDDPYEEVAFRVDDAAADILRKQKLPGVLLVADQWRSYPAQELAAQVVGFVGYKGDKRTGVYGLERSWQDTLAKVGDGLYVNPFAEIFTNIGALVTDPASNQGSILTSIEPSVQDKLESTLEDVMQTYHPKLAGGIVMDPHTGAVIAMGLRPTFDPNTYNTVDDPAVYANQLVEGRYEMGSIMKPLTMAAGIDKGVVTPATKYDDKGCIMRSGKKVCNYDFKARGVVSMQEVLNQSLNTGVTYVADKMGHESFTRYMRGYQLDQKTNIDLPNEVTGNLDSLGDGSGPDVDYAAASFGQGIAVSPIGMTRALASLANGGVLPTPHVVTGVKYDSGIVRSISIKDGARVLNASTTEEVTNMLIKVYDDALLKGELKQEHYTIAAKTGTAQIAIPGGGGYYSDRFLHSFFGYFPAHDPKFIVFLFAVEPHGAEFASATLARPFSNIANYLINYYDIPPDR